MHHDASIDRRALLDPPRIGRPPVLRTAFARWLQARRLTYAAFGDPVAAPAKLVAKWARGESRPSRYALIVIRSVWAGVPLP